MPPISQDGAFPRLSDAELALLKPLAQAHDYGDGDTVFRAGQADIDFYVVESGRVDIVAPTAGNQLLVTHEPGQFSGDIDLLTGRPVLVSGISRGRSRLWRVPCRQLRAVLNRVPGLGEKLMLAFTRRRELLAQAGVYGMRVVGPGQCPRTNLVREFLYKNFVPFLWLDPATAAGRTAFEALGSPARMPVIECGNGQVLVNPSLQELARGAGIWHSCTGHEVDLAIVGAGPAGITAAVYAASEGLVTLVLDRLGPGGQAGDSSRIENFIGFPAGLSGADLATRGVLQMLKFGARLIAPVNVEKLVPAATADDRHALHLDCGVAIRCRVVLLALGVCLRRLQADGVDRFTGAGIHYACTAVEADLYDGRDVVVVGGGNSAGQAVMFLAQCCLTRQVHLLVRHTLGSDMSGYLVERIKAAPNVVVHEHTEIAAVHGGPCVEAVTLTGPGAVGARLPCSAVFVFIGAEPSASWLPPEVGRDANGYVLTGMDVVRSGSWRRADRDPCALETTLPGVLAAGDIRAGSTKRVAFAVGDGALAVTCAHRLISIHA